MSWSVVAADAASLWKKHIEKEKTQHKKWYASLIIDMILKMELKYPDSNFTGNHTLLLSKNHSVNSNSETCRGIFE